LRWGCIPRRQSRIPCRSGFLSLGRGPTAVPTAPSQFQYPLTLFLRTFAKIYNVDKTTSSLLGRPPRLCRRYCSMQLPLDLDDSCLSLPHDQLEGIVNLLDAAGWNREFSIHGCAFTRALLICDMVREDILELSLTTLPQNDDAIAQ
jgi:hypothetical protein